MNRTIYVEDEALWIRFAKRADRRHVSVSSEIARLMREELQRQTAVRRNTVTPAPDAGEGKSSK